MLDINDPVIIYQKCDFEGHTFYCCQSDHISGWVDANDLALFKTRSEWVDAWKVDSSEDNFLVVLQDKIILEKSHMNTATSEIQLNIGSKLKLVSEEDMPETVGERGTWNNYVVYVPTRGNDGYCDMKMALISQHYDVSIGYPALTQSNILDVAFSCLGNRYGWGGCDDAMDCTLYTRLVYKCFGFKFPRNTTAQPKSPTGVVDISSMSDADKEKLIETCPAGTCLYWSAHAVIYTGTVDSVNYVINNVGTLSDSIGNLNARQMYSIILNPLTVRRANGTTWLKNMATVLLPAGKLNIQDADITINEGTITSVKYEGTELYEGINYTVTPSEDTYVIKGINNFDGKMTLKDGILQPKEQHITGVFNSYTKIIGTKFKISPAAETAISLKSSNPDIASIKSNGEITITGTGTATITITAKETADYKQAIRTITIKAIEKPSQDISGVESSYSRIIGSTFSLNPVSMTPVTYISSNPDVASVSDDGTVTITGIGTASITITAKETADYRQAIKTIIVEGTDKAAQKISNVSSTYSKAYGSTFTLEPSAKTTVSYKSSNTSIASVSSTGKVTIKGVGTAKITITAVETDEYTSASKSITVKGVPKTPSISSITAGKSKLTVKMKSKVSTLKGTRYKVSYRAKGTSSWKSKVTADQSLTINNLKKGKTYQVKVCAYRTVNSAKYYSSYTSILTSGKIK